jgi:hypothetical protein
MRLLYCAALALVSSAVIFGCGKSDKATGPKTVPVRGKIVFTKGGDVKTLFNRQGRIELESVEQPTIHAAGAIEEDGSFTVATVTAEGGSSPGAVPGSHRVRLDLDDQAQRLVAPQFLDFTKSKVTITVPSDKPIEVPVFR